MRGDMCRNLPDGIFYQVRGSAGKSINGDHPAGSGGTYGKPAL